MSTTVTNPEGAQPEGEPRAMSINHEQSSGPANTGEELRESIVVSTGEHVWLTEEEYDRMASQGLIDHSGEPVSREFDKTTLGEADARGLLETPESPAPLLEPATPESPTPTKKETTKKPSWVKRTIAGTAFVGVTVGAGYGAYKLFSGDDNDTPTKQDTPEQVTGPDGKPLQYVEFSNKNNDRNNDGTDDGFTDVNNNGVFDNNELWDQENKKFVTVQEATGETGLEDATTQDLEDIAKLETIIGESTSMPQWRKDYIHLDPLVKRRIMLEYGKRADYESDEAWRAAIIFQFDRTPEDIRE